MTEKANRTNYSQTLLLPKLRVLLGYVSFCPAWNDPLIEPNYWRRRRPLKPDQIQAKSVAFTIAAGGIAGRIGH